MSPPPPAAPPPAASSAGAATARVASAPPSRSWPGAGFARDSRGAASIELAIGAVVLLAVSMLGFDLYSRVEADATGTRMAATMADYVSRETDPDGEQLTALGRFLYEQELGLPADLVYVISAIAKPPGDDPAEVVWADSIPLGDEAATQALAGGCGRFGAEGGPATLPDDFTMADGEVIIAAEVCLRLRREGSLTGRLVAGDIYRLYVLPARGPEPPAPPVYDTPTEPEGVGAIASLSTGAPGAGLSGRAATLRAVTLRTAPPAGPAPGPDRGARASAWASAASA